MAKTSIANDTQQSLPADDPMQTHTTEDPMEVAIPTHPQPPTFSQNLELLGKVSDDLQSDQVLEDNPHLSSMLDTEQPVPHSDSGTNLQDIERTFFQDSENVGRRMLYCVNVPIDDKLITNLLAPMETSDEQGLFHLFKSTAVVPPVKSLVTSCYHP